MILSFFAVAQSCRVNEEKPDEIVPRREDNPSHVLIETFMPDYETKYWCSGVLVSADYVLTTGMCVFGQMFVNVHVYAHNLRDVFEPQREIYRSSNVQFKPEFDGSNYLNDLALIKLPVTLDVASKSYVIAQLPPFADQLLEGREGTTVGWGLLNFKDDRASKYKTELAMKVVSDEACREAYPKWEDESMYRGRNCIQSEGGSNCVSDVGSPFMIGDVVYGLQSFGQMQGCESNMPSGIQEVRYHKGWIDTVIGTA